VAFLENEQPAAKDKNKDKEKGPQAVAFIPKSAVRSDSNASFVFLVRDGKVERRAVNLAWIVARTSRCWQAFRRATHWSSRGRKVCTMVKKLKSVNRSQA